MSQCDDVEFVNQIIQKTEKFLCGEIAKLKKAMQRQDDANELLERRVSALETENERLRNEISAFHSEMEECKSQQSHDECSSKMQRAFTAGLNTLILPPLPVSGDLDRNTIFPMPVTSTPKHLQTQPTEQHWASKLHLGKRKAPAELLCTNQIYTCMETLSDDLRQRLEPYVTGSVYSTRELLNTVQRAYVKYKVNEIKATGQKLGEAYINAMIQEGVEERIWTSDFKPSAQKTLAEYLAHRIKNERKLKVRKDLVAATNSRLNDYINDEIESTSSVGATQET